MEHLSVFFFNAEFHMKYTTMDQGVHSFRKHKKIKELKKEIRIPVGIAPIKALNVKTKRAEKDSTRGETNQI